MLMFAPEHCYKHGTAVVKNTGMSKVPVYKKEGFYIMNLKIKILGHTTSKP